MTNFLTDYLHYTSGNEVNEHYHIWSALSALSSCVSRKVWVEMGYFRIYPWLYIVLLGPPRNGKNTALGIAKRLVREVGDIPFSAECQSAENLTGEMLEYERAYTPPNGVPHIYTPISIFATELSQFFIIDPVKMVQFLTTVYDQEVYDRKTNKYGHQLITGPFVSLLGCTTPDWVTSYLKTDIITGGFSRRTIFVLEDWTLDRRVPIPYITPEMDLAFQRCIERGRQLKTLYGPFQWTDDAKAWYIDWYLTRKITTEATCAPFDKNNSDQILKVAMLLELCKSDDLILHLDTLQLALSMLEKILVRLPDVFSGLGRNELAQVSSKLEAKLRMEARPFSLAEIKEYLWREANGMEQFQVTEHLKTIGAIVQTTDPAGKTWVVHRTLAGLLKSAPKPNQTPPVSTAPGSVPLASL